MVSFNAIDETHGLELWKSDGTASGTVMLSRIFVTEALRYSLAVL